MDPVGAISVLSDYLIQKATTYWISRGLSAGAVSMSERLIAPVKDVAIVNDYIFQSKTLDDLVGRVGRVGNDGLQAWALSRGTDALIDWGNRCLFKRFCR